MQSNLNFCVLRCVISVISHQVDWVIVYGTGVANKGTELAETHVLVIKTWVALRPV